MDLTHLIGMSGTASLTVGPADLAVALGSGDVDVLGTPRLVALCEAATVDAIALHLPSEVTSVGVRVELDHLLPNRLGDEVIARATVTAVTRRRVTFDVHASSGESEVGSGTVHRAVVDRFRFA